MAESLPLLQDLYLGNSPAAWLAALAVGAAVFLLGWSMKRWMGRHFREPSAQMGLSPGKRLFCLLFAQTKKLFILLVSIGAAAAMLELSHSAEKYLSWALAIGAFLQIALWANAAINFYVERYRSSHLSTNAASVTTFSSLAILAKLVLLALLLLFTFHNLGVNITAMLTGLGIGGIAIALAAQNVLGDLFASLSIVMDKPFVLGDFIVVGKHSGTVEKVGMKTTRIRSLAGEQIIFSNTELLKNEIRNYQRMAERRVVFEFSVGYGVELEELKGIPAAVKGIIEKQPKARFDRAHLKQLGDLRLPFEAVYYLRDPDYNFFMDVQQEVCLQTFDYLKNSGIPFGEARWMSQMLASEALEESLGDALIEKTAKA